MQQEKNNKPVAYSGFEAMLEVLLFIVFSGRSLTWKDIQENVSDKSSYTIARYLNALVVMGFLERSGKSNRHFEYKATDKAIQLFGANTSDK